MTHIREPILSEMKRLRKFYNGYYILTYTLNKLVYNKRYFNVKELRRDYSRLKNRYKLAVNINQFDVGGI